MNLIMNLLSNCWFDYEFIIYFAIWLWIHDCLHYRHFFRSWNNYELTINFAIWLWFICLSNEIIMNSLYFSQIYFEITMFLANSPWIHHLFANILWAQYLFRDLTINSSFFSQTHSQFSFFPEFTIFLANSQWIHYFVLRFHYEAPIICVWIHYQFLDLTINALFVRFITMDSLAITLYDYELTNGSAEFTMNSLSFREFTMNSLSFSRIHYKNTIFFVIWLQYLFRWSTMYFQFFSLTFYWSIIVFANSLWIHYLFRKFIINSQDF